MRCAETRRSRAHMSSTHDEEAPQKLLRVVVYTTLSRAPGVQGIYRASVSNICSAVAGTAYVVCAEPFILWLPRLQNIIVGHHKVTTQYIDWLLHWHQWLQYLL